MRLLPCLLLLAFLVGSLAQTNPTLSQVLGYIDQYYPTTPLYSSQGLGNCSFPISSTSTEAQEYFNVGICMLHTFWPEGALRVFRHVIKLDSTLAIGYWGLYQALNWDYGFVTARNEALTFAMKYAHTTSTTSEREQLYIQAELNNQANFKSTYQTIINQYPWDNNAKSFWAWYTISHTMNTMGNPKPGRAEAQALLEKETSLFPRDMGFQHYTIHAWEDTLTPEKCLDAVEKMTTIAPLAGHSVHMPGLIYFILGKHDAAYDAFNYALKVDEWAMGNFSVTFMEYWEYTHNIAYMVATLGEAGRFKEAQQWGTFLQNLPLNSSHPLLLDWDPVYSRAASRYYFQGLLALPLLQFQYCDWAAAVNTLKSTRTFLIQTSSPEYLINYFAGLGHYACAMQAFDECNVTAAQGCVASLQQDYDGLRDLLNSEDEFKAGETAYHALGTRLKEATGALQALNEDWDTSLATLAAANISEANTDYNEPPIYSRPVITTQAEVLIRRWNATKDTQYLHQACTLYKEIVNCPWHKNSGFGWYGIARVNALLEDEDAASSAYENFMDSWQSADQDLPQVIFAKNYTDQHSDTHKLAMPLLLVFVTTLCYLLLV